MAHDLGYSEDESQEAHVGAHGQPQILRFKPRGCAEDFMARAKDAFYAGKAYGPQGGSQTLLPAPLRRHRAPGPVRHRPAPARPPRPASRSTPAQATGHAVVCI